MLICGGLFTLTDSTQLGIAYIDYALSQNKQFRLISIDEAPQNEYVCTPYLLGALVGRSLYL